MIKEIKHRRLVIIAIFTIYVLGMAGIFWGVNSYINRKDLRLYEEITNETWHLFSYEFDIDGRCPKSYFANEGNSAYDFVFNEVSNNGFSTTYKVASMRDSLHYDIGYGSTLPIQLMKFSFDFFYQHGDRKQIDDSRYYYYCPAVLVTRITPEYVELPNGKNPYLEMGDLYNIAKTIEKRGNPFETPEQLIFIDEIVEKLHSISNEYYRLGQYTYSDSDGKIYFHLPDAPEKRKMDTLYNVGGFRSIQLQESEPLWLYTIQPISKTIATKERNKLCMMWGGGLTILMLCLLLPLCTTIICKQKNHKVTSKNPFSGMF